MTTTMAETVEGRLSDDAGKSFPVRLRLVVKHLPNSDERSVSECRLASGTVPDGTYAIEYFYHRPYSERVRVQSGMLLAG